MISGRKFGSTRDGISLVGGPQSVISLTREGLGNELDPGSLVDDGRRGCHSDDRVGYFKEVRTYFMLNSVSIGPA